MKWLGIGLSRPLSTFTVFVQGSELLAEDSALTDGCPAGSTITVPGYCISRFGVHANAPLDRISCRELEDRLRAEGNEDEHEYNLYGSDL